MHTNNMLASGTELYMKCLMSLQQQSSLVTSSTIHSNATNSMPPFLSFNPIHMHNQYAIIDPMVAATEFNQSNIQSFFDRYPANESFTTPFNGYDLKGPMHYNQLSYIDEQYKTYEHIISPLASTNSQSTNKCHLNDDNNLTDPTYTNLMQFPSSQSDATVSDDIHHMRIPCELTIDQKSCDTEKIRRPMNSFMIYAKRHRSKVHEMYPQCDNRTVSKLLSQTWYALDSQKKREYHELASQMRDEHFRLHPDFKWKTVANNTTISDCPNANLNIDETIVKNEIVETNEKQLSTQFKHDQCIKRMNDEISTNELGSQLNNQLNLKQRIQTLPQFDFSTYPMKNDLNSLSLKKPTINYKPHKNITPIKQTTKECIENGFIASDFDANRMKSDTDIGVESLRSLTKFKGKMYEKKHGRSLSRQLLDQRRNAIMKLFHKCGFFPSSKEIDSFLREHINLFGTKALLNVKIREYRQKLMQKSE